MRLSKYLPKHLQNRIFRSTLSGVLALTLTVPALASPVQREPAQVLQDRENQYRNALAQHALRVREANQIPNGWLLEESKNVNNWNQRRGQPDGPDENFDMELVASKVYVKPPTLAEMASASATQDLALEYYGHQGLKRYLGTFIESGSSYADGYEWNTQRWAGLKVPSLAKKLFQKSAEKDILNVRYGMNLHELNIKKSPTNEQPDRITVDAPSIQPTVDLLVEAWKNGISPTLSILFFPSLKRWETKNPDGTVDPSRSYLNHPNFISEMGQISAAVLKAAFAAQDQFNVENMKLPANQRLPEARFALNPVNEPETLAGFTGQFWAGAFAKWNDPNGMKLYVSSILQIAKASVRIRMEADRAANGKRILYFHNEAMTPVDYPSHKGDGQFAQSKLILGDSDLLDADLKTLATESLETIKQRFEMNKQNGKINIVDWCILSASNIPANRNERMREEARQQVIKDLTELKNLHLNYTRLTAKIENGKVVNAGKTAKTDTILMLDYYQQSEFILPRPVPEMIKDFSANNGLLLKKIMQLEDEKGFLNVLEEKARIAERLTGQKFWNDYTSLSQIDLQKFLSQEDAIILDKLIGLRNEWSSNADPLFVQRRKAVGISEDLTTFNNTDEKRSDALLNSLLADNAKLLKSALAVTTDTQLMQVLQATAQDTRLGGERINWQAKNPTTDLVRAILNQSERTVLHRLFGLERHRRTGFLPPHYARQTRAQLRKGLYETYVNYINQLGIRIGGIGESGTPYYPWAAMVHKQMVLAMIAAARKTHFYLVRYDLGPLVGTIGWMLGPLVKSIKENSARASDGIMKLVRKGQNQWEYEMSNWPGQAPWFETFKNDVLQGLGRSQARIEQARALAPKGEIPKAVNGRAKVNSCSSLYMTH